MENIVTTMGIKYVYHFTRLQNAARVLNDGLISRQILEVGPNPPIFNDEYRYDQQKNAICCTIGHPNYKVFYPFQMAYKEEWVIIVVQSKVLWELDCAFCVENAASNNVTTIPINARKGVSAFKKMFEEIEGKPSRKELEIIDRFPTNPQAEILVFNQIDPKYIQGVAFKNMSNVGYFREQYPNFTFKRKQDLFYPRNDYEHWR